MKKLVPFLLTAVMTFGLFGCTPAAGTDAGKTTETKTETKTEEAPADKPAEEAAPEGDKTADAAPSAEAIGDTIKFDPAAKVNNGEPIEVEFWIWTFPELFTEVANDYMKYRPNVTIKVVQNPWEDYWTKLPLALKGESGPAIYNVHNSQHELLINYMAPLSIPVDEIEADFINVKPHIVDGNVYYVDYGLMTSSIYYNTALWEEAGLTDADIPTTWDQFREVAKKLTKFDGDKMTQSGFNINGNNVFITALNYQKGITMFDPADNKTPIFDNATTIENMNFILDLYNKDQIMNKDFGTIADESFGNGQTAMVYNWGWFNNYMHENYPDIKFGMFELPTFDGKPFAFDRTNGESTMGVNKNASPEQQEVAQDFVRFVMADNNVLKKLDIAMDIFPTKKSLATDTEIIEKPVLKVIAKNIDRYIWPGPYLASYDDNLKKCVQDILYNGVPVEEAVKAVDATMKTDFANSNFVGVEPGYEHYSEKK